MVTKDEGKAELFNAFFAAVINCKNRWSPGMQIPEVEENAIIQDLSNWGGPVEADWKLAEVTPIYKKGQKEDPGTTGCLTLRLGKEMEKIVLSAITAHAGQAGDQAQSAWVWKGRSCLSNFISFYNKVTLLVDQGKAVDVFMCTSKAFDTISHNIILEKLAAHHLDR
ncbi:hypothetical protein RLOC_00005284 [Lonchura striata]|uniref:Rna-directed dna polymerase from mobile element jockey-like n=1 Tax=Lonchura striata TaxID=40157 RepID=A0A218VDE4_9PASE|nr:hypothetical protein RLOC_00005284 [Lonchura striata domestica]